MTQVEERLVEALREIGKTAFAEHEPDCTVESLTGWLRTIVGPVLAEYDKQHNQDYPECSYDPTSCPENEGYGCCNTRTPSPASPTRSDTREQAAASPSAVGKGLLQELVRAWDTGDFVCDEHFAMLMNRARSFAAQAPKPASAGGELDDPTERFIADVRAELIRARAKFPGDRIMTIALAEEFGELAKAVLDEPAANVRKEAIQTAVMAARVTLDGDSSVNEWRAAKGLDPLTGAEPIAAEADTAKDLPWNHPDWPEFVAMMPSTPPDRLAPIEARGVLETIRFHLRRGDHVGADGHRCTQQLLDAIEKALRARESAPAVETPPNGA